MQLDIVKIGKSKGIRLPAAIIKECRISSTVDMEVIDGKIIISPTNEPRDGWDKAFKKMHMAGDDHMHIPKDQISTLGDWEW